MLLHSSNSRSVYSAYCYKIKKGSTSGCDRPRPALGEGLPVMKRKARKTFYFFLISVLKLTEFQFSSVAQSCPTLRPHGLQHTKASLSITNCWSLLKCTSVELVMPSNHLILCRPLLLLPSIFLSIRVFSNESVLRIRWPKDWSFSFSISLTNAYSGLISFRMDWLDLLAVQGTFKSLLQHHSSKASILQCSAQLRVVSNSHIHTWLLEKP